MGMFLYDYSTVGIVQNPLRYPQMQYTPGVYYECRAGGAFPPNRKHIRLCLY